jgi:peptidoglycan/LPS O-acetylase OafA/YrhL
VFFLGIILYFFVTEKSGVKMISPLLILLFSGMFIAQLTTGVDFMPHHIVFSIALLFFAFSLSVYQFKLFVNPVINYLGKLSYSMYLIHFAVIHWVDYFGLSDLIGNAILDNVIRFLIVLVPTVLISTVSYKLIELPFQNLGKRLIEKMEQKSVSQL